MSNGKSTYRGVRQRPWGKVRRRGRLGLAAVLAAAKRRPAVPTQRDATKPLIHLCPPAFLYDPSLRRRSGTQCAGHACGWAPLTTRRRLPGPTTPLRAPSGETRPCATSPRTPTTRAPHRPTRRSSPASKVRLSIRCGWSIWPPHRARGSKLTLDRTAPSLLLPTASGSSLSRSLGSSFGNRGPSACHCALPGTLTAAH